MIQAVINAAAERGASAPRDPVEILRAEARDEGWATLRDEAEEDTDVNAMSQWLEEQRALTDAMNAMYNANEHEDENDDDDEEEEGGNDQDDGRAIREGTAMEAVGAVDAGGDAVAAAAAEAAEVTVTVGTSQLISDAFVRGLYSMINDAYGQQRVTIADVRHRLRMGDGDAEGRANRVLHLAWRRGATVGDPDALVGCCSSTIDVPWCNAGCGHWGLLVVGANAQGRGVGRALVAAAERRLCGAGLRDVQMEYEYTVGDAHSERLRQWYEGTLGFSCESGPPDLDDVGATFFRRCRKRLHPRAGGRRVGGSEASYGSGGGSSSSSSGGSDDDDDDDDEEAASEWSGWAAAGSPGATPRRPTPRVVVPPEEPGPRADPSDFEEVD